MSEATTPWTIERVSWDDPRAVALRAAMDAELGPRYADRFDVLPAEEGERVGRALAIDPATIVSVLVAVAADGEPVGHAALRDLGGDLADALEVKRVYVAPRARGTGASRALMAELEVVAAERGARRLILQTGDRQPDAVVLYERIGYTRIPVYPPYLELAFSNCFEKAVAA